MPTKLENWKEKAKTRRIEIWKLNKRLKEVLESRRNWKEKYQLLQAEHKALKKEVHKVQEKKQEQVKHHSYTTEEISFYLNLKELGGCSYRGCIRVVQVLQLLGLLQFRQPSPSSIRNWSIKLGHHQVSERCESIDSEWVLIIDESISIGSEKILLLLGIDLSNYDFGAPLSMQDVEVLSIRIKKSWKAVDIQKVINSLTAKGYRFKYACSDNGNNLRKALKVSNIVHVEDCGHYFGKVLEKRYKNGTTFQEFSRKKALFKKQNLLSEYAAFLPPKQRTKGRFMNLWPTCKWARKLVGIAKKMAQEPSQEETYKKIAWIVGFEEFIEQLYKEQQLINHLNKIVKSDGLSLKSISRCIEALEESQLDEEFTTPLKEYLNRNFDKLSSIDTILCSSDIIESMFGKFKNTLAKNSMSGLTEGSLAIANYGKIVNQADVKKAMESTKIVDILKWREENLPISMQRKKAAIFKSTG